VLNEKLCFFRKNLTIILRDPDRRETEEREAEAGLLLTGVRAYYTPENLAKTLKIRWPGVRERTKCIFTALHLCRVVLAMSEMYICMSVKFVNSEKTKETVCQNFYTT